MKNICLEIEKRYQINFLEIGTDEDHAHFLVQSVPTYSVTKIVTTVKSITARGVFKECREVKKELWGGESFGLMDILEVLLASMEMRI